NLDVRPVNRAGHRRNKKIVCTTQAPQSLKTAARLMHTGNGKRYKIRLREVHSLRKHGPKERDIYGKETDWDYGIVPRFAGYGRHCSGAPWIEGILQHGQAGDVDGNCD